jgi:hypothetical protein
MRNYEAFYDSLHREKGWHNWRAICLGVVCRPQRALVEGKMVKRLSIYLGVQVAYLVLVIIVGALVMAKPTDLQAPIPAFKVPSNESDQDRLMDELYEEFEDGKIDLSEARRRWEEKHGVDPLIKSAARNGGRNKARPVLLHSRQ